MSTATNDETSASSASTTKAASRRSSSTDYSAQSTPELLSRIAKLESQLLEQFALVAKLTSSASTATKKTPAAPPNPPRAKSPKAPKPKAASASASTSAPSPSPSPSTPDPAVPRTSAPTTARSASPRSSSSSPSPAPRARPFDPSRYTTRHIALKFAYLGSRYGGYEHANGNVTPQPTIEEVLWKALRKARLIFPTVPDGCDDGYDVLWAPKERRARYIKAGGDAGDSTVPGKGARVRKGENKKDGREGEEVGEGEGEAGVDNLSVSGRGPPTVKLDLNWEGCQYSKCGRTDRGVSAFGQVIGIRVRSKRPARPPKSTGKEHAGTKDTAPETGDQVVNDSLPLGMNPGLEGETPSSLDSDDATAGTTPEQFDPIKDELPYLSILNAILPPDIRILAWCPSPPADFDARFSCRERQYKYFFTNPAFCPTPGPRGFLKNDGSARSAEMREGWLDVAKMKEAAKKLEGLHDFRNLCKIDASKQMENCVRRITFADVVEWDGIAKAVTEHKGLGPTEDSIVKSVVEQETATSHQAGTKVYAFCVHGTAFLWHQVRCMVAVLFLVGQGLEEPGIIDKLLDVEQLPRRPAYDMAADAPLVLWDCVFNANNPDTADGMVNSLDWVYAGDEATLSSLSANTKSDGKFGTGALVDGLWAQWRDAKMHEILAGSLLDLAISQGDGSPYQRGEEQHPSSRKRRVRSQKVFDGSGRGNPQGKYVSVLEKRRVESLEVLNAKWLERQAKRAPGEPGGGDEAPNEQS